MIDPRSPELNYVVVMGVQSPGRAQLTGVGRPYNWDIQPGFGLSGAFTRYRGPGVNEPTLTIVMWDPLHFAQWEVFKKVIQPPTPTKPFFVAMQHPLLAAADIKAIGVRFVGEPVKTSGVGWVSTINLIEYRPPLPIIVKPKGAVPAPDKGKPIPPKTEADKALVEATAAFEQARAAARAP